MTEERRSFKPTMLNERKVKLAGLKVEGSEDYPLLGFSVGSEKYPDAVKLIIKSNIAGDRGNGLISGFGDITSAFLLTTLVRAAAAAKGAFKRTLVYKDFIRYSKDSISDTPKVAIEIDVIRTTPDEAMKLVVRTYKRPDLVFPFIASEYHPFIINSGEVKPVGELSIYKALGWCDMVEHLIAQTACHREVTIYGDKPNPDAWSPSLKLGAYNNTVSMTVFTNVESDKHIDGGRIGATVDPASFYAFLREFDEVARAGAGFAQGLHNYYRERDEQGQAIDGSQKRVSTTWIGRDNKGLTYLKVVSENPDRPVIPFYLRIQNRWSVTDDRGKDIAPEIMSTLACRVWQRVLGLGVAARLTANFTPPDVTQHINGGGSEGGTQYSGGGQSRSAPPEPTEAYDETLDFL